MKKSLLREAAIGASLTGAVTGLILYFLLPLISSPPEGGRAVWAAISGGGGAFVGHFLYTLMRKGSK